LVQHSPHARPPPPPPPLFPYTTLFRSARARHPSRCASRAPQDDRSRFQISFPIATAVSIMRLEKPHSLSNHDSTVTIVPSITLRSEEHTSELQSRGHLVCRLLLEKKKQ